MMMNGIEKYTKSDIPNEELEVISEQLIQQKFNREKKKIGKRSSKNYRFSKVPNKKTKSYGSIVEGSGEHMIVREF
ncbi:MAG: hypothetical protein GKR88_02565 [Flavobacteriaceae bacterium]|nr:MAG: hypothetical protein GKR88_02565 [Flavobacteriaceae bacterium]